MEDYTKIFHKVLPGVADLDPVVFIGLALQDTPRNFLRIIRFMGVVIIIIGEFAWWRWL